MDVANTGCKVIPRRIQRKTLTLIFADVYFKIYIYKGPFRWLFVRVHAPTYSTLSPGTGYGLS